MTEENPTLQDVWRLLGRLHRRIDGFDERFDTMERQLERHMVTIGTAIGALKESIEARDFRLDEHGRRLTKLEQQQP